MIRSMWSAVSGLRNHQIFLDVTGNNIANVNTHGYKAGRAIFEDSLSQMVRGASAPVQAGQGDATTGLTGVGGTNPAQIGLGVRLGSITNVFTQGGAQVTNLTTDVAIQGDGFFQVKKGDITFYTRNGAFNFDSDGFLVTSDGSYVMGTQYAAGTYTPANGTEPAKLDGNTAIEASDATYDGRLRLPRGWNEGDWADLATASPPVSMQSFQITPDGQMVGTFTDNSRRTFGQIDIATFNNPPGLEKVGGSLYNQTNNSGNPQVGHPRSADRGALMSGTLEMSNVDLAAEFTNLIVAQRGFQANSKVITASDEVLQELVNMKR